MIFFILGVINILALLPFTFVLPDYVYDQPSTKLRIMRILPKGPFIAVFCFLFGFWCAFSLVLLSYIGEFNPISARLDIGCSVLGVCVLYCFRMIVIYYREGSDVQSRGHYVRTFVKEIVFICILTAALETVSFMLYSYLISAAVGLLLLVLRIHKFAELRKKYKER